MAVLLTVNAWTQNANLVLDGTDARWVNSGPVYVVLRNADFSNNGSTASFEPGTSTVLFTGGNASTVGGSASSNFYNLGCSKPLSELLLGADISILNNTLLDSGNINLQNATLDLHNTGTLVGEGYPTGNRIYCDDDNTGRIKATRILTAGSNANIAGLGLDINVTGSAPGSTVIYRGHDRQTSTAFVGAGTSIGRYYDITPSTTSGFTYELLFRYHDQELGGITESDFVFYRSASYGTNTGDWQEWGKDNGIESPGYPMVGIATHNSSANTVSLTGIHTFSRWTVSNSLVSPLPVELTSFTASCTDKGVSLRWTTASEINNAYFRLQRSADLQNWDEVATVAGAGNSNAALLYTEIDERPLDGLAYYRLSQTDYDGTTETFLPVSVSCKGSVSNSLSVFPNPADRHFTVAITVAEAHAQAKLELCDLSGKRMLAQQVVLASGSNLFTFDRTGLPSGAYFIRVYADDLELSPLKLIIQ